MRLLTTTRMEWTSWAVPTPLAPNNPKFVGSTNITVSNNYIHGNALDGNGHSDAIQTYSYASGLNILDNLVVDNGKSMQIQQLDTDSTGISPSAVWSTIEGNIFFSNVGGYAIDMNADSFNFNIENNVIGGGWGPIGLTTGTAIDTGFHVTGNIFYGKVQWTNIFLTSTPATLIFITRPAARTSCATSDNNSGAGSYVNYSAITNSALTGFYNVTGQDQHSQFLAGTGNSSLPAAPLVNGPLTTMLVPTYAGVTPTSVDVPSTSGFDVGDFIELNDDGVARQITSLRGNTIFFANDPLPMFPQTDMFVVDDWGPTPPSNLTLNLLPAAGSVPATMGPGGAAIGPSIIVQNDLNDEFDGNGQREVPVAPAGLLASSLDSLQPEPFSEVPITIGSLSINPSTVIKGSQTSAVLTAVNVQDPSGLSTTKVAFYLESNGTTGLQTTGSNPDTLLGNGTRSGSNWSLSTTALNNLTPGTYTCYAMASDYQGVSSVVASSAVSIFAPPTVATPAAASANPVTGTTAGLSVLGADSSYRRLGPDLHLDHHLRPHGRRRPDLQRQRHQRRPEHHRHLPPGRHLHLPGDDHRPRSLTTTSSVTVTVAQTLTAITVAPATATSPTRRPSRSPPRPATSSARRSRPSRRSPGRSTPAVPAGRSPRRAVHGPRLGHRQRHGPGHQRRRQRHRGGDRHGGCAGAGRCRFRVARGGHGGLRRLPLRPDRHPLDLLRRRRRRRQRERLHQWQPECPGGDPGGLPAGDRLDSARSSPGWRRAATR